MTETAPALPAKLLAIVEEIITNHGDEAAVVFLRLVEAVLEEKIDLDDASDAARVIRRGDWQGGLIPS